MNISPAKILSSTSHLVPGKIRITECFFQVPLDYSRPGSSIYLFARSARKHDPSTDPSDNEPPASPQASTSSNSLLKQSAATPPPGKYLPWLLYLQGGPGFECRAPQNYSFTQSFLDKGYELLFLDQRGTGMSSPLSVAGLAQKGNDSAQAAYLKHFRADNIVRDAEAIRLALTADQPEAKRKWSTLGQSFGGFCTTTYLSMFPASLRECFLTGGLPPLVDQPDEVYKRLFKKVVERNKAYYDKYPEDVDRVKQIVRFLRNSRVQLPTGEILTSRRFLQLGLGLGSHSGIDGVHENVLRAASELTASGNTMISRQTLDMIGRGLSFDNNLLYALLHEPIYCQGSAANWSADRVLKSSYRGFDPENTLDLPNQPIYFTGEMIFRFMFEDGAFAELQKLRNVANILAADSDWPALYDRKQLARNTVPVYAAVYMDDMYVDLNFSMETAQAIRGCKTFITNQMYHNALGAKTDPVVEALWKLRCDTID